ncbi:MAG: methyltransferase family protein [Armatimonadota bacterium]
MPEGPRDSPGVIALPPVLYAAPLALAILLHLIVPLRMMPRTLAWVVGALLVGLASVILASGVRAMARARTEMDVRKPTTAIVVDGPFRYTRNPLYVALTLLYLGIAALINTLWPILLLPILLIVMQRGVIEREERYLERKFGDEYLRYKARVRRWL